MISVTDIKEPSTLDEYAGAVHLAQAVRELRETTGEHVSRLEGQTVWMVNSTEKGGGVAEMLPKLVPLLRELGVRAEWAVMQSDSRHFFELTKRLHNMLHGEGDLPLTADDRALYEKVSREAADAMAERIDENDLLVIHDPQPLAAGAVLKERLGVRAIWRCHIGLDQETPSTRAAWDFLKPWARAYDRTVFSIQEYVPSFLEENASIIPPSVDPLSHKNRELPVRKVAGILSNASLTGAEEHVLTPSFETPALRLQPDGSLAPATQPKDIGLLFRPIVTQVSRWDRLKGFGPLLDGFARLKARRNSHRSSGTPEQHQQRLDLVRLVLAGPDPSSIQDDPEGLEVFEQLRNRWLELDPEVQRDVAFLVLPMESRRVNALMVNALQRCSTIVAQNSLREGFGLTVTEAMWKGRPVLGTHAVGIREQVRNGVEGRLLQNPEDPEEIADVLDEMLKAPRKRQLWGQNAQLRVANRYLLFAHARHWLNVLSQHTEPLAAAA